MDTTTGSVVSYARETPISWLRGTISYNMQPRAGPTNCKMSITSGYRLIVGLSEKYINQHNTTQMTNMIHILFNKDLQDLTQYKYTVLFTSLSVEVTGTKAMKRSATSTYAGMLFHRQGSIGTCTAFVPQGQGEKILSKKHQNHGDRHHHSMIITIIIINNLSFHDPSSPIIIIIPDPHRASSSSSEEEEGDNTVFLRNSS